MQSEIGDFRSGAKKSLDDSYGCGNGLTILALLSSVHDRIGIENGPVDGIATFLVWLANIPAGSGCAGITDWLRRSDRVPLLKDKPLGLLRSLLAGEQRAQVNFLLPLN